MAKRKEVLLDQTGRIGNTIERLGLPDWEFHVVPSLEEAGKALLARAPLVGLVAFDSPDSWGERELESLMLRHDVEWIAILARELLSNRSLGTMVLRSFHDFHTLPLDHQRLMVTLGHAHGKALISHSVREPKQESGRYGMTGRRPKLLQLYRQIDKIVTVDAPVLIGGESGTGKELVARAIHQHSERAAAPFIAMNCGAIPANLIHSELFGYEHGAFTGAKQRKIGTIEAADGGVLFLDEIGDLPLDLQASLLRFLQEKTIVRLGHSSGRAQRPRSASVNTSGHGELRKPHAPGSANE